MDDKDIKVDLKWFDDLLANISGTQMSLFDDTSDTTNTGAATITTAASPSIYPYVTTNSGTYTFTNGTGRDVWNPPTNSSLNVKGDAEFEGDIKLKGKSLTDTLNKIEQRLGILHPNKHLEEKWEELKKLGDTYRQLEKDILEKEKIWNTLKK